MITRQSILQFAKILSKKKSQGRAGYSSVSDGGGDAINFATDVVDDWARKTPNNPALFLEEQQQYVSYAELSAQSQRFATALTGLGLKKADRVLILVGRRPEWWYSMTAALRSQVVAVPGTTMLRGGDILHRVQSADIKAVIADPVAQPEVDAVRDACPSLATYITTGPASQHWLAMGDLVNQHERWIGGGSKKDDLSLIFFTSGTTADPKQVLHTHAYPFSHRVMAEEWLGLDKNSLHLNLSDTGWAKAAWSSYFGPLLTGSCTYVQPPCAFDAKRVLDTLENHPITHFCAPSTVFRALVGQPDFSERSFSRLQEVVTAGEHISDETVKHWQEVTGIPIRNGYGQTETTLLIAQLRGETYPPESLGRVIPPYKLVVLDKDNQQKLGPGEVGEIAISTEPYPPGLFGGYQSAAATKESMRGKYYSTGDLGYYDPKGNWFFSSRDGDMIITAGYRVAPAEVESALLSHPAVLESGVVGVPDNARNEIIKAFIVLKKDIEPHDELIKSIQDHVKQVTAPYKYPREVKFVDELPKTISGKILRRELRALRR